MASNARVQVAVPAPVETMDSVYKRNRLILSGLTAVIGTVSVATNLSGALDGGVPSACRAALGAVGVLAGVLLWLRPDLGWRLGWLWALVQIPIYAWSPDGSPTAQALSIPLSFTSKATMNGVITSYSALGINLVGIILFVVFQRLRIKAGWRNA